MYKLLFILLILVSVGVGLLIGKIYTNNILVTADSSPAPSPNIKIQYFPPAKISIPKIGVEAIVEKVGEDSQGRMDVPKDADNVGWYEQGFKVGEKGTVVIDGHLDKVTGAPAVFWNLNQLVAGDEIKVLDEAGKEWTYRVVDKKIYDFDKVPLQEIFALEDKPRLNLITCNGIFDHASKNYSKRMVVYSELAE